MNQPIQNSALTKLSPDKTLSEEQTALVTRIMRYCLLHITDDSPAVFTIYGDAGTGKSVVLSKLFSQIQNAAKADSNSNLYCTNNFFLVNHPEVLKVYKQLANSVPTMLKKQYLRPTSFINQMDKQNSTADIVIIDEAHLLLSKPDHYNNFYYDNQLLEIIKRAKVVIIVFDEHQVLRMKSLWTSDRLERLLAPFTHDSYHLKQQFRMTASPALIDWFDEFTDQAQLNPIPIDATKNYDFRVFDDAEEMRQAIVQNNDQVGLSRILSTSGYPSILDGGKHYITEGQFKMPWDQYNYTSTPWAELPDTIDEVGSIYTCQGFDLNYAGIILGPPIYLDSDLSTVKIDLSKNTDPETFKKRNDLLDKLEIKQLEEKMIMNSLNVLFKRGIYGTYLYAHDPKLRRRLVELFEQI